MLEWIVNELPAGAEWEELPSLGAEHGSARLSSAAALIGEAEAARTAREAGYYLLEDKLAWQLKLQGLQLGKGGEVPALSPARWHKVSPRLVPIDASGLYLAPRARKRFLAFLRGQRARPAGIPELITLARHFFYEEAVKVAVPTRTRV